MKKLKPICTALIIAFAIMSCSGGSDSSGDTPSTPSAPSTPGTADKPTYTSNIKAIIDGNCISCHGPGGEKSDVPLTSYDLVKARAADIKTRIEKPTGDPMKMPKGGSLSQANIDIINKWIANGMPN